MGVETWVGARNQCFAVLAEELEHDGAGVDGIGFEIEVVFEELGEEAAVSVA